MAQLSARAKHLGLTPERLAKQFVEAGLALEREAEASSFARIMGPVRRAAGKVTEREIIKLVEKARGSHNHSAGRPKKG